MMALPEDSETAVSVFALVERGVQDVECEFSRASVSLVCEPKLVEKVLFIVVLSMFL